MNKPTLVTRSPPQYPEGGRATVMQVLSSIANLRQDDGNVRKSTVILASPGRNPPGGANDYTGIAARITYGSKRGAIQIWTGVPAVVPLEASYVLVEAMLVPLPYQFGYAANGLLGKFVQGPLPGVVAVSGSDPGLQCTAYVIDDWASEPNETILFDGPAPSDFSTPLANGPVVITAIKFANRGTSGVQFAILDRNGGSGSFNPIVDKVFAPAGATTALAIEKPFFRGCVVAGCLDWNVPAVYDSNAADVDVSVYGYYLGTGNS